MSKRAERVRRSRTHGKTTTAVTERMMKGVFALVPGGLCVCGGVCGPLWQLWMSFCEQTSRGHLALSQNAFQYITSPLSPPFIIRDGSTVRAHWEPYSGHWYSHLNMNDAHHDADGFNQSRPEYLRSYSSNPLHAYHIQTLLPERCHWFTVFSRMSHVLIIWNMLWYMFQRDLYSVIHLLQEFS